MTIRTTLRHSAAALALVAALGTGTAGADPIAGAVVFTGNVQFAELQFGDSYLTARLDQEGGPIVEVQDGPPFISYGTTGKGGGDVSYGRNGLPVCALNEGQAWSLVVDPQAKSATLTSSEPGCAGVVEWIATGPPTLTVAPSVTTPGVDGPAARLEITTTREAAATGAFAGDPVEEVGRSIIRYTRIVFVGGFVP